MSVVFVMAPIALLLAAIFVAAFIWASRDGQFEDTETPAHRVLFEERPSTSATSESQETPGRDSARTESSNRSAE